MHEKLIFEHSAPGRSADAQYPRVPVEAPIPAALRRASAPLLPEVSELQAERLFTRLSQLNFSIDTHFYPLGSCTMKYNPKACNQYAMLLELRGARIGQQPVDVQLGLLARHEGAVTFRITDRALQQRILGRHRRVRRHRDPHFRKSPGLNHPRTRSQPIIILR